MALDGILTVDDRVELLEGLLVTKMTKNERHILTTKRMFRSIDRALPSGWHVCKEDPISLAPHDEPEPDLAILRGDPGDYRDHKPTPHEVVLVVEVSDTSYAFDQQKLRLYARAGIPRCWIANVVTRQLEDCSEPVFTGGSARYQSVKTLGPAETVPLILDGQEVAQFLLREWWD